MQPPWCLLCDRNRAGGLDEVVRGGGGGVVEEGLRSGGERSVGLRHEDEGTLDGVAAVENGLLGAATPPTVTALTVSLPSTAEREA